MADCIAGGGPTLGFTGTARGAVTTLLCSLRGGGRVADARPLPPINRRLHLDGAAQRLSRRADVAKISTSYVNKDVCFVLNLSFAIYFVIPVSETIF